MKNVLVLSSGQLSVLLTVLACTGGAQVAYHRTEETNKNVLLAGRGVWPGFRVLTPTKENEVAEIRTCGETTSGNGTSFVNPSYPGTDATVSSCQLTVELLSDVCQLRLDFDTFELAQPNVDGGCVTDFMKITGTAFDNAVPTLCGTNTGKHMYVDLDPTGDCPKINIDTAVTSSTSREWNITIQQIPCDSRYRAPVGCTQYYRESSGVVESFNYAAPTAYEIAFFDTNLHLNNLRYSVCIASRSGYCSITWSKNDDGGANPYTFFMSNDGASIPSDLAGTLAVSAQGAEDCPADYVVIPGGEFVNPDDLDTPLQADRFCGLGFPNQVTSNIQPFILHATTDESEVAAGDNVNVGFSLLYRLNVC